MVKILNQENTILNKFLAEMRDKSAQKDSMRFRRNLERVGEIMAYEISKKLNYKTRMVETPLGIAAVEEISDKVVVATILRAGLPFHQGFLNYFDDAESGFVSAYRKSRPDGSFIIDVEYVATSSASRFSKASMPNDLRTLSGLSSPTRGRSPVKRPLTSTVEGTIARIISSTTG